MVQVRPLACLEMRYVRRFPSHPGTPTPWRHLPVVQFALERKKRWGLGNVHFLSVNANVDLARILGDLVAAGYVVGRCADS